MTNALISSINNNNPTEFLVTYFELIEEGQNLSVPSHLELSKISEGWNEILKSLNCEFTTDFLNELSTLWLSVIKKQGGQITDTFANDILKILNGPSGTASSEEESTISLSNPDNTNQAISQGRVVSNISSAYQQSEAMTMPRNRLSKKEALKQLTYTYHDANPTGFIKSYLELTYYDSIQYPIPKTSLKNQLLIFWQEQFMRLLNDSQRDAFLGHVNQTWFNLTNKYGIPSSEKIQNQFINELIENENQYKPKIELPKKELSFFEKLKKIFS